jgi:hypothetical protein
VQTLLEWVDPCRLVYFMHMEINFGKVHRSIPVDRTNKYVYIFFPYTPVMVEIKCDKMFHNTNKREVEVQ